MRKFNYEIGDGVPIVIGSRGACEVFKRGGNLEHLWQYLAILLRKKANFYNS